MTWRAASVHRGGVYDDIAAELAEMRHGVTSADELRRHGVSADTIRMIGESRHWDRATPKVLRRVGSARTQAQALAIAVLDAGPNAFLSHLPGARWWGRTGCSLTPVHVVGTSSSTRRSGLVRYHRVRRLPETWTTELSGIPIVRPELLALQLFAVCTFERAEQLTEGLWADRLLSGQSLRRFIHDMGRMGRNGTAGVRRYLDDRPDDYVPPATGLEHRVQKILRNAGIDVCRQVNVGSLDNWTARVDFVVQGLPVVIEVQSEKHHRALVDSTADLARRQRLESAGFTWVELWDDEVWSRPWVVVDKVRAGIRQARLTRAL